MNLSLSYYPDITQYKSLDEIRAAVVDFSKVLEENYSGKIGQDVKINVLPVMSVKEQTHAMTNNETSIGLMKPVSYVLSRIKNQQILPAAVAWRLIHGVERESYFAQLYTRKSLGINTLNDIKSKFRVGFGDSFSTSNFLIPANELLENGINPLTGFRKVEYFGGHDHVAKAVYLGETDIGAGHDGAIYLLSLVKGYEDAESILQPIKTIDIHSDPVAINTTHFDSQEQVHKFCESLHEISEREDVKAQLQKFWGNVTKLGPTKHSNYRTIETAIDKLRLTEKDILN